MPGVGWRVDPFSLIVPPGSPPGTARIVITGRPLPPPIDTQVFVGGGALLSSAIIFESTDLDSYMFMAFDEAHLAGPQNLYEVRIGAVDDGVLMGGATSHGLLIATADNGVIAQTAVTLRGDFATINGISGLDLVTAAGAPITANGDTVTTRTSGAVGAPSAGSTASASFADVPGGASASIAKEYAGTKIGAWLGWDCFASAIGTAVEMAVQINGVDNGIAFLFFNVANQHLQMYGYTEIGHGAPIGSYTVKIRWRRSAGAGNVQCDTNGHYSLALQELSQ